MQEFRLETFEPEDDYAIIRIAGEIDISTAPQLRELLRELTEKGRFRIVLDLGRTTFLDSTALGVVVGGFKRVRTRKGSLSVVMTEERLLRIFRITGLVKVFPAHPTLTAAISADEHWRQAAEDADGSVEKWCDRHGLV